MDKAFCILLHAEFKYRTDFYAQKYEKKLRVNHDQKKELDNFAAAKKQLAYE